MVVGQARRSCILCTQMRSGSWLLSDLCHQTGLLGRPEEYFRPDFRGHWSDEWGIGLRRSYGEYVASAVRNTSTPNGVFGVKMHSYQMDWFLRQLRGTQGSRRDDDDLALLRRWLPDPVFVRLRRLDVARQAISYYRAVHSDVWFEMRDDDPTAATHNPVDPPAFPETPDWGEVRYLEDGLRSQERIWSELFARNGIHPLELTYEEISGQPDAAVRRILRAVDIEIPDDLRLQPRLKKQADASTDRWLEQYLVERESVTPTAPRPRTKAPVRAGRAQSGPPRGRDGTSAPGVFPDDGPQPARLVPADYVEGRVSWAELTTSLVRDGSSLGAAAAMVDALPGAGAPRLARPRVLDWRRTRTPLPPGPPPVDASIGVAATTRTCILAGTPWSGSRRLGLLLARTGAMAAPRAWFDPIQVPAHGRRLAVPRHGPGWPARYLTAVRREATAGAVCGISLTWAHQRWLVHMARVAVPTGTAGVRLDSDLLAWWFPDPRYVWVRARDVRRQALRWYAAGHPELVEAARSAAPSAEEVDYQEVRWLESSVRRQERGWETYFAIHRVRPLVVHREDLAADVARVVGSVLDGPAPHAGRTVEEDLADDPAEPVVERWLEGYLEVRGRLGSDIGVGAAPR